MENVAFLSQRRMWRARLLIRAKPSDVVQLFPSDWPSDEVTAAGGCRHGGSVEDAALSPTTPHLLTDTH